MKLRSSLVALLFTGLLCAIDVSSTAAATPCIRHEFVSEIADGPDTTQIRPSDWNACHIIEDLGADIILYAPDVAGDWLDPDPETVAEALDQLAAQAGMVTVITGPWGATECAHARHIVVAIDYYGSGLHEFGGCPDGASSEPQPLHVNSLRDYGGDAVKTDSIQFHIGDRIIGSALTDGADYPMRWENRRGPITITEIKAYSDAGTPSIQIQRNDGSPANICTSALSATTGGATCTIDTAEDNLAVGHKIDFVMATAGGVAKEVFVVITYTVDPL